MNSSSVALRSFQAPSSVYTFEASAFKQRPVRQRAPAVTAISESNTPEGWDDLSEAGVNVKV